jgi:uncharacterized membrane protein (DUF485 family)
MAAPRRSDESLLNRAYGCFAFLGLATLPVGFGLLLDVLHWMNFDEGSTGGTLTMLFGMALATPLAIGMVGASIFGIRQTVRFRHPALVVLSMVSIVCGVGLIVLLPYTPGWNGGPDSPIVDYGMGVAFGIFIAANLTLAALDRVSRAGDLLRGQIDHGFLRDPIELADQRRAVGADIQHRLGGRGILAGQSQHLGVVPPRFAALPIRFLPLAIRLRTHEASHPPAEK